MDVLEGKTDTPYPENDSPCSLDMNAFVHPSDSPCYLSLENNQQALEYYSAPPPLNSTDITSSKIQTPSRQLLSCFSSAQQNTQLPSTVPPLPSSTDPFPPWSNGPTQLPSTGTPLSSSTGPFQPQSSLPSSTDPFPPWSNGPTQFQSSGTPLSWSTGPTQPLSSDPPQHTRTSNTSHLRVPNPFQRDVSSSYPLSTETRASSGDVLTSPPLARQILNRNSASRRSSRPRSAPLTQDNSVDIDIASDASDTYNVEREREANHIMLDQHAKITKQFESLRSIHSIHLHRLLSCGVLTGGSAAAITRESQVDLTAAVTGHEELIDRSDEAMAEFEERCTSIESEDARRLEDVREEYATKKRKLDEEMQHDEDMVNEETASKLRKIEDELVKEIDKILTVREDLVEKLDVTYAQVQMKMKEYKEKSQENMSEYVRKLDEFRKEDVEEMKVFEKLLVDIENEKVGLENEISTLKDKRKQKVNVNVK